MKRFARTNQNAFDSAKADVTKAVTGKINELFDKAYYIAMSTNNDKTFIDFHILEGDTNKVESITLSSKLFVVE